MSKAIAKKAAATTPDLSSIEKVLISGDLSALTSDQRVNYYNAVCNALGLNPLTKPFDYITLNGKLVLYANKGCAEQLRANRKISVTVRDAKQIGDVYMVIAEASDPSGRVDSSTGAVSVKGLAGEVLANAFMKCETKAKRRVTLSICSLNMLDETEVASIPDAAPPPVAQGPAPQVAPKEAPKVITPPKITREAVGAEVNAAKRELGLTNDQLKEWSLNKSGKPLTDLNLDELIALRDELQTEIGRM